MNAIPITRLAELPAARYNFDALLRQRSLELPPVSIETLQANITKLCNQVCRHCHVDASPSRTEKMSRAGIEKLIAILAAHPQMAKLDITGGAPELHPDFDWLVGEAIALGRHVMVRHNL
ncbi:MAG: arsenosugar biosynthesis radical SAM (seleno)protein ArsS, partial [Burkholderiales bacterium]